MPVSINYRGRFGNHLCQYIAARIFAHKHNLNLLTKLDTQGVFEVNAVDHFADDESDCLKKKMTFLDFDENDELKYSGKKHYIFDCYFENGDYFSKNEALIKTFFKLPKIDDAYKNDVVIHLRLGDRKSVGRLLLDVDVYKKILNSISYSKLYIVSEKPNSDYEKKYLEKFNQFNPIFVNQSMKDDFLFILKFNTIICSYFSTFCYWAAFFSKAKNIYTQKKYGYSINYFLGIPIALNKSIHKKNYILSKLFFWKHFNVYRIKNMNNIKNLAVVVKTKFIWENSNFG